MMLQGVWDVVVVDIRDIGWVLKASLFAGNRVVLRAGTRETCVEDLVGALSFLCIGVR